MSAVKLAQLGSEQDCLEAVGTRAMAAKICPVVLQLDGEAVTGKPNGRASVVNHRTPDSIVDQGRAEFAIRTVCGGGLFDTLVTKGRQYARNQQMSRFCRLEFKRRARRRRREEAVRQQRDEFQKFDAASDLLCFLVVALKFSSHTQNLRLPVAGVSDRCRKGLVSEERADVAQHMVKVLQMYHVRIVSAISQQKWREQNGVSDPSIKGDAKAHWVPLVDPKIDFRDRRPAHLRGVYNRLRAAAVKAGVDREPELDPFFLVFAVRLAGGLRGCLRRISFG